ncbi:tripartite tricarboxylate transporter substrate-binding protein [Haloechinothrix sp. LS1_15]|uniref:Bug family tripartite tricarboxylate transporter substrate binding protein n=1 Tax=Haloechinothrix sp. LS1_15 TaxID=2652248 RepID=UPI0029449E52|nr:tripartite tricarboxylate transporter substrate-binding protein [Haloechinothrix sp. LS1_15]MDV6012993.1 tripartite tricarboxylate transporter substrate binding protein [Haloechinothrix sp. LS1_15]
MRCVLRGIAMTLAALLGPVACGTTQAPEELRVIVPTPPGGGFDQTARTLAGGLEDSGLAESVEVLNMPGETGMAALSRARYESGDDTLLLQMGLGLVATAQISGHAGELAELTPLARVVEEAGAIVVPAGSDYGNLPDLVADLRDRPGEVAGGGGSQPGGPDHLAVMLLADELGIDPAEVSYHSYDGGGELLAGLLSHEVDYAAMGAGEHMHAVEAGELRVLAVTGPERVRGIDAPTLTELGVDLEFVNWRGLLAPPGLAEDERDALIGTIDRLRDSAPWREAVDRYGWEDSYLAGEEYGEFLDVETRRVADVLDALGLRDSGR